MAVNSSRDAPNNSEDVETILLQAAVEKDFDTIEKMVNQHDANINIKFTIRMPALQVNHNGGGILHVLAGRGKIDTIEAVIKLGADICLLDRNEEAAIHIACKHGNQMAVHCLLVHDHTCKDIQNKQGITPLLRALNRYERSFRKNYLKIIQALIDFNCDVNLAPPNSKFSPLHVAADKWDPQLTEMLVRAGADVNAQDQKCETPLLIALSCKRINPEVVRVLVAAGAKLDVKNRNDISALQIAVSRSDDQSVQYLLDGGANPNVHDNTDITPLWIAVEQNDMKIVKLLLEHGVDINYVPVFQHMSVLMLAIEHHYVEMTRVLLQHGRQHGIVKECTVLQNPLTSAIQNRNIVISKMLLYENCPLQSCYILFSSLEGIMENCELFGLAVLAGLKVEISQATQLLNRLDEKRLDHIQLKRILLNCCLSPPTLRHICHLYFRKRFSFDLAKNIQKLVQGEMIAPYQGTGILLADILG